MTEQIKTDFEKTTKSSAFSESDIEFKKGFLNKFIAKGFPSKKYDNWKFSDINQIIQKNIGELSFYNDYSSSNKIDTSIFIDGLEHNKIVFINGRVEKVDFDFEDKDKIVINEDSKPNGKLENSNSLIDLNSALANRSYKILVKENYSFNKPLIVYHISNNKIKSKNINLRLEFELEQNSSLKLIDIFNDKSEKNFINIFYNFDLKKDAILKNYKIDKIQNNNIKYSFNNINQDENSVSETFILSAGSDFLKNEINCNLNGKYSSAFVNGIFSLMNNQQHLNKSQHQNNHLNHERRNQN